MNFFDMFNDDEVILKIFVHSLPEQEQKRLQKKLKETVIYNINNDIFPAALEKFKENYDKANKFVKYLFGEDCTLMSDIAEALHNKEKNSAVKCFRELNKGDKFKLANGNHSVFIKINGIMPINAICIKADEPRYIGDKMCFNPNAKVFVIRDDD